MRKIVHISDLHFGTEKKKIANGLLIEINKASPNLVIVSGDLTQRARSGQFKQAKEYLDKIEFEKIIIPGNHDIPLFDIFRRFFTPLNRFKEYITKDIYPYFEDNEIAVLGINSARSLTWKNGRISIEQIQQIEDRLCKVDNSKIKIIVTHHPFIPPPGNPGIELVGRSIKAIKIMEKCKISLLLAGHLHHGYSGDVRPYYPSNKSRVISAQAGTAISNRIRNEPNTYNFITIDKKKITIKIKIWKEEKFEDHLFTAYEL